MKIRLNERFYIEVDPHNKLKYELFEEVNDRALRHGAMGEFREVRGVIEYAN